MTHRRSLEGVPRLSFTVSMRDAHFRLVRCSGFVGKMICNGSCGICWTCPSGRHFLEVLRRREDETTRKEKLKVTLANTAMKS